MKSMSVEQIIQLALQQAEKEAPPPPSMEWFLNRLKEHATKTEIDSVRKEDAVRSTILKILRKVFGRFEELTEGVVFGLVTNISLRLEPADAYRGAGSGIGGKLGERINLRGKACYIDRYTQGVCVASTEEQPPSVQFINRDGNVKEMPAKPKGLKRKKIEWQIPLSGEAGYLYDRDLNIIYIMEVQENEKPN